MKILTKLVTLFALLHSPYLFGKIDPILPINLNPGTPLVSHLEVCNGCEMPELTVSSPSGGNGFYQYQWQMISPFMVPGGEMPQVTVNFINIIGATGASYTPPSSTIVRTFTYRRAVTSNGMTAYSDPIDVTILPPLEAGEISYDQNETCYGSNIGTLNGTLAQGGDGAYEYRWKYDDGTGWKNFPSSNFQTFTPDHLLSADTQIKRNVRSAGSSWVSSNVIEIVGYDIITSEELGTLSASESKVCPGELVEFTFARGTDVKGYRTRLIGSDGTKEIDFGKIPNSLEINVHEGFTYFVRYNQPCTSEKYTSNAVTFEFYENCNVPPSQDQNFVRTEVPRIPVKDEYELSILHADEKSTTYAYSDGLGRPSMSVAVEAGQDFEDVVQFSVYNAEGRQEYSYLPYYKQAAAPGEFIETLAAIDEQENFYTTTDKIGNDAMPYSKTEWDARGRVKSVIAPGEAWHTNDKKTTYTYAVFDPSKAIDKPSSIHSDVIKWKITNGQPKHNGTYKAKELSVVVVTDVEGRKSRKVTDGRGLTITSQIYDKDQQKWIGSYNVYDDLGRLRFIIPPLLVDIASPNQAQVEELAFQYIYDNKGRVTDKHAPGAGWVRYVYDHWNRLVLTRHSAQRREGKKYWTFYKYDALNRQIFSGEIHEERDRGELQGVLNLITAESARYETVNTNNSRGYTKYKSFPDLN
ncbi:MAG: DUF6443 domain-containing protein, partial [Ekhidna sp.]|uniref:DUF6443 domain-containing protein n=1 Tax=Ekhidna sp. TaxID=2608089 RepID=UPI0032ED5EFE